MSGVEIVCASCGKVVLRCRSQAARGAKFCSQSCNAKFRGFRFPPNSGSLAAVAALRVSEVERFWARVQRGETSKCWLWTGGRTYQGYGRVSWRGKKTAAHRVALALIDGLWDSHLRVCHSCDNPPCCNPAHLWRGTDADNVHDMHRKGRFTPQPKKGEDNPNAILTTAAVIAIRQSQLSTSKLAAQYGISKDTVLHVKRRERWGHIP